MHFRGPWVLLPVYALLVGAAVSAADEKAGALRTLGGSLRFRAAIERAGQGLLKQLQRDECRRVFTDFRDRSGRTLQENLDALGQDPSDYVLRTIRFTEGSGYTRRCQDRKIAALTEPGSHVVMLCEGQFVAILEGDPKLASAILIHETLHTLGLSENPPSPEEITARVLSRCK